MPLFVHEKIRIFLETNIPVNYNRKQSNPPAPSPRVTLTESKIGYPETQSPLQTTLGATANYR